LIIFIHAAIEVAQAFLNHFTLFALMLRIKDPARLPAGIKFKVDQKTSNLVLEVSPVADCAK